jgi:hypothetical protein
MSASQSGPLLPMRSSGRFPPGPRGPLGASVTFWEATAPVKLPAGRCPGHRCPLDPRDAQSGVSSPPPRPPRGPAHGLPPTLRSAPPGPTPSCSEAPRGLFVLPRVGRIFTAASISPGPPSRQRPDRYAIRAGRNSPDKEFRYLRTVIVTAAVHRGFGSGLRAALPLTFRHWAGVSPYTAPRGFAGTCVFGKQSPGPILCAPPALPAARAVHPGGSPFSRSYGGSLPSSLRGDHPFASVLRAPAHLRRSAVRTPAGLPSGFSRRPRPTAVPAPAKGPVPVPPRPCGEAFTPPRPARLDAGCSGTARRLPRRVPASVDNGRPAARECRPVRHRLRLRRPRLRSG